LLNLRVTPEASGNAIDGPYHDPGAPVSLRVRVTAQPDKGKANKAVIQTLAQNLGLAKIDIIILSGTASRHKTVRLKGDPEAVKTSLQALIRVHESWNSRWD